MKEEITQLQGIQERIFEIRRKRVMLDFDLAEMYGVETRRLKEQVKRNQERFPDDFMFQLTKKEWLELIANCDNLRKNIKYIPAMPFAQEGVAMRQLVLSSPEKDIQQLQEDMKQVKHYIEDILIDQNEINEDTRMQLELINKSLAELQVRHKALNKPRAVIIGFKPC